MTQTPLPRHDTLLIPHLGRAACLVFVLALLTLPAPVGAQAPSVVVTTVDTRKVVEPLSVAGTVTSPRAARLSTEVAGRVEAIEVEVGTHVAAGALLLRLEPTLAGIERDSARAAAAQARVELADARRREADARRLVRSRGIAKTTHESLQAEVQADAANLQWRESQLAGAQERLKRHELRAPFAGVVSARLTEMGEWLAPGDEAIELIADQGLRVDVQVPQAYFPRLDRSVPVQLQLAAMPEAPVDGRVGAIVPVSDPTARSFLVRVHPVDEGLPLTPGMSATARFSLATGREGVVVPRDALLRHPDGRVTVWVVGEADGTHRVEERVVRPGIGFDGQVEIREGLAAGEQVVVEGNEALQQDQAVTVRGAR